MRSLFRKILPNETHLVMNVTLNSSAVEKFPTYWQQKKGITLIKRLSSVEGRLISGQRKFNSFDKTHFGNSTLFEERLSEYKEISEDEFNDALNSLLSKTGHELRF